MTDFIHAKIQTNLLEKSLNPNKFLNWKSKTLGITYYFRWSYLWYLL